MLRHHKRDNDTNDKEDCAHEDSPVPPEIGPNKPDDKVKHIQANDNEASDAPNIATIATAPPDRHPLTDAPTAAGPHELDDKAKQTQAMDNDVRNAPTIATIATALPDRYPLTDAPTATNKRTFQACLDSGAKKSILDNFCGRHVRQIRQNHLHFTAYDGSQRQGDKTGILYHLIIGDKACGIVATEVHSIRGGKEGDGSFLSTKEITGETRQIVLAGKRNTLICEDCGNCPLDEDCYTTILPVDTSLIPDNVTLPRPGDPTLVITPNTHTGKVDFFSCPTENAKIQAILEDISHRHTPAAPVQHYTTVERTPNRISSTLANLPPPHLAWHAG